MARKRVLVFIAVFFFIQSSTFGLHWNLVGRLCTERLLELPDFYKEFPIPVGCEIVDCCPGCPGPERIDWRIKLNETVLSGAILAFEGLNEKQVASLKLEGNAKIMDGGKIILGTGEIKISGVPGLAGGKIPLANLVPNFNPDNQDALDQNDAGEREGGIEVTQFVGPFQVNRFSMKYILRPCNPVRLTDRIKVNNNTSNDNTVILMDFKKGGACVDDNIVRTANTANLGNVQAKGTCNSEVGVFSDDNAMSFQSPVNTWTNNLGDLHNVNLAPVITVPVSVWVAGAGMLAAAQNDIANTNFLYNQNNVGVQFNATFNNVSGNAAAVAAIGTGCPANAAPLQASAWYTANRLNAYYVNSAFTGVNCGADRNLNFIGTTANLGSLPHEFGHAYGLRPSASWGHTNGLAGFGNNNIMWGGGPGTRNNFTVAQSFRLNVSDISMLNLNGNRTGITRTCAPNTTSNLCPALSLDNLPH